ncbi:MAG: response regulator transcription factor [Thermoanaerobaculia bacterium]
MSDFDAGDTTNVGSPAAPIAVGLFVAIVVLIGVDVAADYRSGTEAGHLLTEGLVMALALTGAVALWRQLRRARQHAGELTADLAVARREAERFREEAREALRGLGEAIDRQFGRWELTPAEREVGLLLLKGLSHKEVAAARSTSETTIRQQALSIYRKSGLRSRSELSAFFLEDLLLPAGQR